MDRGYVDFERLYTLHPGAFGHPRQVAYGRATPVYCAERALALRSTGHVMLNGYYSARK